MSTLDPLNYADYIRSRIRTVPDWPQAGVQFRDITRCCKTRKPFACWSMYLCTAIWTNALT